MYQDYNTLFLMPCSLVDGYQRRLRKHVVGNTWLRNVVADGGFVWDEVTTLRDTITDTLRDTITDTL